MISFFRNFAFPQSVFHRAVRLGSMGASHESALISISVDLRKARFQFFLFHIRKKQRSESRSVAQITLSIQHDQFSMPRRVASPTEFFADLARFHHYMILQKIGD